MQVLSPKLQSSVLKETKTKNSYFTSAYSSTNLKTNTKNTC